MFPNPFDAKPDWEHWSRMETVSLLEAVALSFNYALTDSFLHSDVNGVLLNTFSFSKDPRTKSFRDRFQLALSSLKPHGTLERKPLYRSLPHSAVCVNLAEFGAWAKLQKINLPEPFPSKKGPDFYVSEGSYTLVLPYPCPFMILLKNVIDKYYANEDPDNPPKQDTVARELADACRHQDVKPFKTIVARLPRGAGLIDPSVTKRRRKVLKK